MTRRTFVQFGVMGVAPAFLRAFPAKEFWNEKKPSDWNSGEIEQLLTKSPWAKEAAISYYGGQNGPLSNNTRGSGSSRRQGGNASSGTSPSAASPADWKAVVRWESALPIRDALKTVPPAGIEKFYILNMVGNVPSIGADPDGLEQLKLNTKLEHKGDAINLSRVAVSPRSDVSLAGTLFYFSRDLALRPEDKVATFSTKLGPIDVKCKFTLRDMMYRGNLEL